jgi:N-acetylglucosamine-6-phosphate deacetylase
VKGVAVRRVLSAKRVYADNAVIDNGMIEIMDGRIGRVGRAEEIPARGAEILSFDDALLLPGFIDIHIHGWKSIDVTDGSPEELEMLPAELAREGVTSFVPTLISCSEQTIIRQVEAIRKLCSAGVRGARILGVHLEGPWLSYERRGAHPAQWVRSPEEAEVHRILERTGDIVRAVTFSPEVPGAEWLAGTLSREGILGVIGHSNASYEQARRVIDAGARHVTHMYNAMLGFRERPSEPGTIEAGIETAVYLDDRVTAEVIPSLAFVPAPLLRLLWRTKGSEGVVLVTDAGRGAGFAQGYTMEFSDGRKARVCEDALRLVEEGPLNNALLGNKDPLPRGLTTFARGVGASFEEVLPTVSRNPARILGMQDELGGLGTGRRADIVALDDSMHVLMTMVAGEVVYRAGESERIR